MTKKARILLVDDDADLLRLLSLRLTSAGYTIQTAGGGQEAMALLPTFLPNLVITDLRMEGMDGMALFAAIRRDKSSLPVIILTAHGSIPDAVTATRKGVFSFLTKPINGQELLEEVEKALHITGSNSGMDSETGETWRDDIICQSPIMEDLLGKAKLVAMSDSSVMIRGQSGTGKELLAKAIHKASPRRGNPFIAVNCGAIPEPLLESELFGHIKGSFTGATRNHAGLFQSAEGGTLMLDEIGDTPLPFQVKLLRVLQERQVRAVGSTSATNVNVRIISATHQDIEAFIKQGNFREDLYYRLNVVVLEIPSLTQRREDIPLLANTFLKMISTQTGKKINGFAPEAMEILLTAPWPGNIRQLRNVIEQSVALSTSPVIATDLVETTIKENQEQIPTFADAKRKFEQDYLIRLLHITNGNVTHAARLAHRNRTDFYKLMQRNHIVPALFKNKSEEVAK